MRSNQFYCVRCRDKVSVSPRKIKHVVTKNDKHARKAKCPECDCKMFVFEKKSASKSRKRKSKSRKRKSKSVRRSRRH